MPRFFLPSLILLMSVYVLPADAQTTAPSSAAQSTAETPDDAAGVEAAVEDYLLGLYDAAPERIERSVSRDLVKYGFWRSSPDADYRSSPMNYEQLYALAERWNMDNRQGIDEYSLREIVVYDVLDKTAVAKLTADWGIDYFQLEKIEGKWMIRHVIWQSAPLD
ncbi:MAG: hypothetical protein HKN17_09615 [Rhodothermales bacterium]|nr:hypothetical protein [Rhodothermales bacterium]